MIKSFSRKVLLTINCLMIVAGGIFFANGIFANPAAADSTAETSIQTVCNSNTSSVVCQDLNKNSTDSQTALNKTFQNIINILLYIAGTVAVIMIIMAAIRMVSSRGEPGTVEKARNSLLYSVAGLVVAVLAFAIVNFVLAKL